MTQDANAEVRRDAGPPLVWLTAEVALYGVILCLALALRLAWLSTRIMDVPEAEQAWQAWQLAHGRAPVGDYSPLLLTGQAALFALFGASDVVARLLPALAGSAIVVLPYWLRSHLGRVGALVAALSLAVSPTLVYSARYGGGSMLLTACMLGVVVFWLAFRRERRVSFLYAAAVLGAVALLADFRIISVLIVLGLAWAIERVGMKQPSEEQRLGRIGAGMDVPWKNLALTAGVVFVLLATAFAFNPGGLGAWADLASAWVEHLQPVINGQPWYYALSALFLYEPFLLVFGAIGIVDLVRRPSDQERPEATVLVWLVAGFLAISLAMGGRDAGDVALFCAPLALIAGRTVGKLVRSWQEGASLTREGILSLVVLVLLVYVVLESAFYARSLYLNLDKATQFLWFWLLAVALLIVLCGLSLAWFGNEVTWRVGGAVMALILVLNAFSGAVGLNFRRPNDPRELHILTASSEGTRDLLAVMADLSYHERGFPGATPVTVERRLGAIWPWYLRDWEDVTVVDELTPDVATPLVLGSGDETHPALGGDGETASAGQYTGQDFVTRVWWEPSQLVSNDRWSWWLHRQSITQPVPVQKVILWVQVETKAAANVQTGLAWAQ
jgi:uncharacterized protein (TIGR03663 family)